MPDHRTTTTALPGNTHTAACSCGWTSPGWATKADAEVETGWHLEEQENS